MRNSQSRTILWILAAFMCGYAPTLLADDPILTEEFFDRPATDDPVPEGYGMGEDAPPLAEPKAPVQPEPPSRPWFESHRFSGGLGFGAGTFSLRLTVQSFFNEYFSLENQIFYRNEQGTLDDKDYSLENYGFDSYIVAQYTLGKLVTPFVGIGPGFEMWSRLWDEIEFDKGNALTASYFLGANLHLSKHFVLQVRHVTKNYITDQQIELENRKDPLPATISYLQVGFLVVF